jgi:hypothetical protein
MPRISKRGPGERGSAFILAPVAVVIVVFLGAIVIDASALFLTRETLSDAAAAAANDGVSAGLDAHAFTSTGHLRLDPVSARRAALASIAAQRGQLPADITVDVDVVNPGDAATPPSVVVHITGRAPHVFLPGEEPVSATASAQAIATPQPFPAG